jgi:protein-L-isoaspartate O-methyltransferase
MNTSKKKTVIDVFAIFCIKRTSNMFWEIADTWSYKNNQIAQRYNNSIEKEYQKECKNYGLSSNSNVLHIGCGAYPLTDIVLSQYFIGTLLGIDKNPLAVQRAQEIVRQHNLQKRITIQHGNGTEFPVDNFDLIIISSCSLPKVQILEHLFKNVKHQSTIVVREVSIAAADVLNCITLHPEIEIIQKMHHTPFPFYGPFGWDTFYLRKK